MQAPLLIFPFYTHAIQDRSKRQRLRKTTQKKGDLDNHTENPYDIRYVEAVRYHCNYVASDNNTHMFVL